jgi:urea transporter/murein DD-endopeptidase MepM/ murein hydrolase activator NlpD
MKWKVRLSDHAWGALNSYGQILFVNNAWLSGLIMLATFLFPYAGLSGFLTVIFAHIVADVLGFDRYALRQGELGFNTLMTGLVLGSIYEFNVYFIVLLALAGLLSMLFTLWFRKILLDHQLPYLSLPFLFSIWILLLSVHQYKTFSLSEIGLFAYNDLAQLGGLPLVQWYESIQALSISPFWDVYFKSMGAIFFQYNLLAGIAISLGLLFFSRISFLFSLIGFATGYFFYQFVDGNFTELHYSYIGFNFILTSIALGSYYLIPGFYTLLVVVFVIPLTALFISAFGSLFALIQLPMYSLPFNIAVLMMIVILRQRWQSTGPQLVVDQQFSPEKNLYTWENRRQRFRFLWYYPIDLPFIGSWHIPQGHDGSITHQGAYRFAWDFDIRDSRGSSFADQGIHIKDYYCYSKPVLSPADGEVIHIDDGVEENAIGTSNLVKNWGNTIVIKHVEGLYSALSHLKPGSITVNVGDRIKKGHIIGQCGSSGRSPEPHLHFQLQATPHIGSSTLWYPLASYVTEEDNGIERVHLFEVPNEGETIRPLKSHPVLRDAFRWEPGQMLRYSITNDACDPIEETWLVGVDMTNATYLYCSKTNSTAWYHHTEHVFHFTTFRGDTNSSLYQFFLSCQKVLLADQPNTVMHDQPDLQQIYRGVWLPVQDIMAPFYRFLKAGYESKRTLSDQGPSRSEQASIEFRTWVDLPLGQRAISSGSIYISKDALGSASISKIDISRAGKTIIMECL